MTTETDRIDTPERWLPVAGWSGYEVSDRGRVRHGARILKGGSNGDSYLKMTGSYGHFTAYVHRLVLTAFVGPCPAGMEALHRDDDPANNVLSNLYWGTHAENMAQMAGRGRGPIGTRNAPAPEGEGPLSERWLHMRTIEDTLDLADFYRAAADHAATMEFDPNHRSHDARDLSR